MKRIVLISLSTPTLDNVRSASALPYHLIKGSQNDNCFEVYSFNINSISKDEIIKIEKELKLSIHILDRALWIDCMIKLHFTFLRIVLKYPFWAYLKLSKVIKKEVETINPDIVWIYGEELAGLVSVFKYYKCIVTMPDSEAMYYHRLLSKNFAIGTLLHVLRYAYAYWQYVSLESKQECNKKVLYHFVGKEDCRFFKEINQKANAVYIRHPLYQKSVISLGNKHFHTPIRVLFAGRYDSYMKSSMDELLKVLCLKTSVALLNGFYQFSFLGKGWESCAEKLLNVGYKVSLKDWVENYAKELQQHDIEISPISVGSGTKGKVLDAFANGLLVIGTHFALENIAVESGKSCLLYNKADEVIEFLIDIHKNIIKYEKIAENSCKIVNDKHNRNLVAKRLFESII